MSELNWTVTHPVETATSLNTVLDMLVDICSRLSATKHFVDEVRADKAAEATHRNKSSSCTCQTTKTSRAHTRRWQTPNKPQQPAAASVADISDAVRAQVANQMRGVPVMDFITSDGDPESGEEATPAPSKKALKLGKIRTSDSSILQKVVW